jgi:hypothetical protein
MPFAWLVVLALLAALAVSTFAAKNLAMSSRMRAREDDEQMRAVRSDAGSADRDVVATLS